MRQGLITAVAACAMALSFSGCGGMPSSSRGSEIMPEATAHASSSYRVLNRFGHILRQRGGSTPDTGLLDVDGTLYGTTPQGGMYGRGTVYSITTAGLKKVIYSFGTTSADGNGPSSDLIELSGTLYGVTENGGSCDGGTVFSLTTAGAESVLHSFCNNDGAGPEGGLIAIDGTLYGTTSNGGGSSGNSGGTVFRLATSGGYTVLHSFNGVNDDGFYPKGRLADINGTIYGTTLYGGTACYNNSGCGTVFGITTAGKERVVYSFQGPRVGADGWLPLGGVIAAKGVLYGTTYTGGQGSCFLGQGCGIVFAVTPKGTEQVLYHFKNASTGDLPAAGLLDMSGTLYGTTDWGGGGSCSVGSSRFVGCGTVFSLTPTGTETVLHAFVGGADGANPNADLTEMNGALYGTTTEGGLKNRCRDAGCGTVFTLSP